MPATIEVTSANRIAAAVVMLLGSDARARDGDATPDNRASKRGWWADPNFGGHVWLFQRGVMSLEHLNKTIEAAKKALKPLIDGGVADSTNFSIQHKMRNRATVQLEVVKAGVTIYQTDWEVFLRG